MPTIKDPWLRFQKFSGFETKADPTKVDDGAAVSGENTEINDNERISNRKQGYDAFPGGSISAATDPITSLHTFRKRDGSNVMMRSWGTVLEYFNNENSTWEILSSGYTSGQVFGYGDYNINTDLHSFVYFGNATESFSRWNGAYADVASVTASTITLNGADSFLTKGFNNNPTKLGDATTSWTITNTSGTTFRYTWNGTGTNPGITASTAPIGTFFFIAAQNFSLANNGTFPITAININYFEVTNALGVAEATKTTGTGSIYYDYNYTNPGLYPNSITINGATYNYLGGAYTNTLTGVTPDPTGSVLAGDGISQVVEPMSQNPKGNIYLVYNNRLFIAGIKATPQAIYFSKYGEATNFVSATLVLDSTATAPGIFNLGEGGGGVVGMSFDEQSMYFFKKALIYKATLTDALYTIQPLKPFDGKSQVMGLASSRGVFTSGNANFVFTADGSIMALERVANIDYPQSTDISDIIRPTVNNADFSTATGITFNGKAYFTYKSSSTSAYNDSILAWDIEGKYWDTPITGWNVTDFTIFDDGTGDALYFASSNSTNVFKILNDVSVDGEFNIRSTWSSKLWDFGMPEKQKLVKNLFIEGNITPETELTITLNFDEDGFSGSYSTIFKGTETDYIYFKNTSSNGATPFGENAFGIKAFGSSGGVAGNKKRFRIYFNKNLRDKPFYNCQLIFSSDGQLQDWEIVNIAFDIALATEPLYRKLFRLFN